MTHEEISKHLLTKFAAEMEDASGYLKMAKMSEKLEDPDLTAGLYEMAKDEFSHADFIKMFMDEKQVEIPEETKEKWTKLGQEFYELCF